MILKRRVSFSSGHRYWQGHLTDAENKALFGKWASRYNHGHNYLLEVSVAGRINPETGMVINIKEIDAIIKQRVAKAFDQKSLNDELPEFQTTVPTTENIALSIWSRLQPLPAEVKLETVRLYETPALYVDVLDGDQTVKLTRVYEFAASHRLHCADLSAAKNVELFGKCNNPAGHGHNYIVEVTVSGKPDATTGMVADIEKLDRIVEIEVLDRYDHKHLNEDIEEFRGRNPTTEVLTKTIYDRLKSKLTPQLEKVTVRETARNIFEYSGEGA